MPTNSSSLRTLQQKYQTRNSTSLKWGAVTNLGNPVTWYERTRTWPTATKRKFPVGDLFLNGTARTTSSRIRIDSGFDYEQATNPRERRYDVDMYGSFRLFDASVPSGVIDAERVYNKIRGEVRGEATNLAQMLAEYRQTAKLFVDLAMVVATKGKSLLRKSAYDIGYRRYGRKRRLIDPSKTAGSAYLQYTYGISPLASDMHSAMMELTERLSLPVYYEGVESRSVTTNASGTLGIASTVSSLKADWAGRRTIRKRYQWRAYISQNAIRNCLVSHGFGNPLAIAWELVPFSFVIDWWINIGEVLQSLDNMLLIDKLVVLESTNDKLFRMCQTNPNSLILRPGAHTLLDRTDTRRVPVSISKVSSFRYKPSVSVKHIMNGLALLTQFRR